MPKKPKKFFRAKQKEEQVKKKQKSPNNSRIIAEKRKHSIEKKIFFSLSNIKKREVWLYGISILAFIGIVVIGIQIQKTYTRFQEIQKKQRILEKNLWQWEQVIAKYPGYRDAYLLAAEIAYRVGERNKAIFYVNHALMIDPNSQDAIKMKDILLSGK